MTSSRRAGLRGWALAIAAVLGMTGCGSGGGGSTSLSPTTPSPTAGQNVLPIIIDAGPANTNDVNVPFVSVTICAPNSTGNCQTIDHVIVDTASTGLRITSSVLSPSLAPALTQQTAGTGSPLVECLPFADGYTWGPVKAADVRLGGESVLNSLAIQVIGDAGFTTVPRNCSRTGPAENTVQSFGANGILGVGVFQQDCGTFCTDAANLGQSGYNYYACAGAACQAVVVALARQIQNPVGLLASDNNGVVIDLPAVAATGAANVTGSLTLGIGTQANNGLGNAVAFALDSSSGNFTTQFNGQSYAGSFIDSGSSSLFFPDAAIPLCGSDYYCPAATLQLAATNRGANNGSSGTVSFSVANADSLLATSNTAFSNLAHPGSPPSFDWGLPFFFGRRVFTAIEGRSSPGGSGPYVAY